MGRPSKKYIRQYMEGYRVPLEPLPDTVRESLYDYLRVSNGYNVYVVNPLYVGGLWTREQVTAADVMRLYGYSRKHSLRVLEAVMYLDKLMCDNVR